LLFGIYRGLLGGGVCALIAAFGVEIAPQVGIFTPPFVLGHSSIAFILSPILPDLAR